VGEYYHYLKKKGREKLMQIDGGAPVSFFKSLP
jgi:hypothetical protein